MKRKILSLITALTLCLSLLPGAALASGASENKSGGWVELIAKTMPVEKTVFKAGSGTITWEPVLGENGVPVSGTVTLNNAEIDAQNGGIVLTVPFTLKLEGKNTITTRVAGPITETGEHCGVSSRLDSLIITGPGSLTVNSAGRAIEAKTDLTVEGGADVTVQSQGTQFGLTAQEGNLTIRDESTVHVSLVGSQGSHNAISANNGTVTIENSHVFSKCQYGAAIDGLKVILKDSDVAAIGSMPGYSGILSFGSFLMDGGTLFLKNTDASSGYDFKYYSKDNDATAIHNAVICYGGTKDNMIQDGDNIQFVNCTYDESSCTVSTVGYGCVRGNLVWNESMPAPQQNFVNAQMDIMDFSTIKWVPTPATITIPAGEEASIPAVNLSRPGSKLVNNGTLTCIIGIRCFGTIEGGGTLNSIVQTREVIDAATYHDTFTAHGDATFRTSFTKIGATRTTSGITTKNMIAIPAGTSMTIPAGNVLDATASGAITKDTLAEYYTNNGTLIVNGTAKFPADTDISALGTITGTGTIIIGSDSWYTVNVTGGTADTTTAKAGDTVTMTAVPITGKTFYGWEAPSGVTITDNNDGTYSFTMPNKPVTITAQYTYTVTFDSQGGSSVESLKVVGGNTATKPSDPTRDKCIFIGWYTDAAGTTAFDFTTPITDDLTLYAKWNVPVESITLSQSALSLTTGGTAALTVVFTPADATNKSVTYTSSDTDVVTVNESGVVTAVSAGTATITVTSDYDSDLTAVCTVTVTAPAPSTSSGSPSVPVSTNTTTEDGVSVTETTASPTADTKNGTAAAAVDQATGNEIVKQAKDNDSENVVIAPKITGDVTKTEVSIPASTVGEIGSQTNASLIVSTPVADVTIPKGGLGSLSSEGGTVTVAAEMTGNTVELSITAGGKPVDSIPGGLTLNVPVSDPTRGTVAVLVSGDGTRQIVRKSVADSDSITIPLDGSAELEIIDNSKHFSDVPAGSWMADAIEFTSAHELLNGTGAGRFSPYLSMSRAMLAVVFYNLENNPEQTITGVFDDVDSGRWYAEGITWAAASGIVSGYGNGMFGPDDSITREQLAVMLWRYAGSPAAAETKLSFTDADKADGWALDALCWAVENGIITGKQNGVLDPTGPATRAEAAAMLMRYLENAK